MATRQKCGMGILLPLVVMLSGCSGVITRLERDPATPMVCDPTQQVCGVPEGEEVTYKVWGKGKCGGVMVFFGDGTGQSCRPWDFGEQGTNPCVVTHKYENVWPGAKMVHAVPEDCAGEARLTQNVLMPRGTDFAGDYRLVLRQPTSDACNRVPGIFEELRKGAHVFVEANSDPNARINFGCIAGGCIYGPDGEPNSSAPPTYPGFGKKKFSLILRVGSQIVQGGTQMDFVTMDRGVLEVCVNDDRLDDNRGAWGIKLTVDESQSDP